MSFPQGHYSLSRSAGHCGFASLNTFAPYRRPTDGHGAISWGREKHWRVVSLIEAANPSRGPYIKDVRTEGGVGPKADIVREVAWIYYYRSVQNSDRGEGVQNPKIFCGRPLCMVP